jgi:hypothetical protein
MPAMSKCDKRIAGQIVAIGLQKELAKGMVGFGDLIQAWKEAQPEDIRDSYNTFCDHVKAFDKDVSQRYNRTSPNDYNLVIAAQLREGFVTEADLAPLSVETREWILGFAKRTAE